MATMNLNIAGNPVIPCGGDVMASGNIGVYEMILELGNSTGYTGIIYDAVGIPDRFEIYYNNIKVADSKFVGDNISNPTNPTGSIVFGDYTLNKFSYNGSTFVPTGATTLVTIASTDISNNINEPTRGNGTLLFNKTTTIPTTIKIVATGSPASGMTAWTLQGICPIDEEDLIEGEEIFIYGLFDEPNKGLQTRSAIFILGDSPVKFYTNKLGYTNFNDFGYTGSTQYINDGLNWWQIDATGTILDTGLL